MNEDNPVNRGQFVFLTCAYCGAKEEAHRSVHNLAKNLAKHLKWQHTKRGWMCRECYELGE